MNLKHGPETERRPGELKYRCCVQRFGEKQRRDLPLHSLPPLLCPRSPPLPVSKPSLSPPPGPAQTHKLQWDIIVKPIGGSNHKEVSAHWKMNNKNSSPALWVSYCTGSSLHSHCHADSPWLPAAAWTHCSDQVKRKEWLLLDPSKADSSPTEKEIK